MSKLTPCHNCKHPKRDHIYEEGACRPGFQCLMRCDKFVEEPEYVPDLSFDAKTGIITVNREGIYHFSKGVLVRIIK